jgi:hypothetical protein
MLALVFGRFVPGFSFLNPRFKAFLERFDFCSWLLF